jgi:hypothetical protein
MPLNAAIGGILRPIVAIGQAYLGFFLSFLTVNLYKKGRGSTLGPLFSIGVLHIKRKRRA